MTTIDVQTIRDAVREKYTTASCCVEGLFNYPTGRKGAEALAYPPHLIDAAPSAIIDRFCGVGNPLGLDQTLSRGIVSAVNRTLPGAAWSLTEPMIQTDASINSGNSGGPLLVIHTHFE